MSTVPAALVGLIDDAAIFPPGLLPLDDAVPAHRAHRAAWYGALVGPFVVDAARQHLIPDDVQVAVVDGGTETSPTARFLEAPRPGHPTWPTFLAEAAATGHPLKFRTGSTDPSAYPSTSELAHWIHDAVAADVAFKCTAGLHRALKRQPDHGFLNVLAATAAARAGAAAHDVEALLATTDPADLLTADLADLAEARRSFLSFGSCSISEPVDDLLALGLLKGPA